ncbi:hypothetical protein Tco_0581436 [Tanacetum coccineum]
MENFSEDYDEELEIEPRTEQTREVSPPLRTRSPRVCRQRERVVEFKEALNKEISKIGRNIEGNEPLEAGAEENRRQEMNLPPILAAHLEGTDGTPPIILDPVQEAVNPQLTQRETSLPNGSNRGMDPVVRWKSRNILSQWTENAPSIIGSSHGKERGLLIDFLHPLRGRNSYAENAMHVAWITLKGQGNPPKRQSSKRDLRHKKGHDNDDCRQLRSQIEEAGEVSLYHPTLYNGIKEGKDKNL